MKGRILDYSVQTNSGIISGDDGRRYTFVGPEWKEQSAPTRGMYVDFEAIEGGSEAHSIYRAIGTSGFSGVSADSKSKVVARLLAILLGWLGIHKFYLGYTNQGIILIVVSIVGALLGGIGIIVGIVIGLVEGIIYLTKSDEEFEMVYVTGRKPWF